MVRVLAEELIQLKQLLYAEEFYTWRRLVLLAALPKTSF